MLVVYCCMGGIYEKKERRKKNANLSNALRKLRFSMKRWSLEKRHQYPLQNMKCVFAIVKKLSSRFDMIFCCRVPNVIF